MILIEIKSGIIIDVVDTNGNPLPEILVRDWDCMPDPETDGEQPFIEYYV